MALTEGARLGPYEVLGPLGAGGMGEVYRARDTRIGREVALKILPASYAADSDRLRRFEQEARAAGALNHPNLLTLFDVGRHDGSPYLVSELLTGETLRDSMGRPRTRRKALDYGVQIANGLAAAHEQGIVHRDLKPENLFVTHDGRVKILDFGLARVLKATEKDSSVDTATSPIDTEPGTLIGTRSYMSPEQVRGLPADHRSDIFAFGAVLYELLTGRRAFSGETPADTLAAILHREPPELSVADGATPPAVQKILKRCLEKGPAERFQSARDLAFALQSLSGSDVAGAALSDRPSAARRKKLAVALAIGVASVGAVALAISYSRLRQAAAGATRPTVSFQQLTFRPGHIQRARFGPDGQTIFYSAGFGGREDDVFFTQPGNAEGRSLGFSDVNLLSVSAAGELAVRLRASDYDKSTLARLSFPGGAPREVSSSTWDADWSPDGRGLAIVKFDKKLQFPVERNLVEVETSIALPRFAPQGDRIAFLENSVAGPGAGPSGSIWVVDLAGRKTRLFSGVMDPEDGLAWSPRGDELWFISRPETGDGSVLRAVDRSGRLRQLATFDGYVALQDIAANGDVLLQRALFHRGLVLIDRSGKQQDLTWLNRSSVADISEDGKTLVFTETINEAPFVYVRRADSADAIRLGEGVAKALSPDGTWVLAVSKNAFVLYPIGAGQSRVLPLTGISPGLTDLHWASWFPDGKRILFAARFGERSRLYAVEVETGQVQPMSPADWNLGFSLAHSISPDGQSVLAGTDDFYGIYSLEDQRFEDVGFTNYDPLPIRWSSDGRHVFFRNLRDQRRLYRLDVRSRRQEPWKELTVSDPTAHVSWVVTTGDGTAIAYTYTRQLGDLYLVKGLK